MFEYWLSVLKEAHLRSWRFIFGGLPVVIVQIFAVAIAAFLLHTAGRKMQVIDELNWFGATVAALVILYTPIFVFHLLRVPSVWNREGVSEIDRLKALVSEAEGGSAPSFEISIERTSVENPRTGWTDEERTYEEWYRIGITNIDKHGFKDCRVVVESVHPAASTIKGRALKPVYSKQMKDSFSISSTETQYVYFIGRPRWGEDVGFKYSDFSVFLKPEDTLPISESEYSIYVAIHANGANTRRAHFRCTVKEGGKFQVNLDEKEQEGTQIVARQTS